MEQEKQKREDIEFDITRQVSGVKEIKTSREDMLIISIIVIVLVVLAFVYMWGIRVEKAKAPSDTQHITLPVPPEAPQDSE